MKIRTGFVSNSSSSSFIVEFKKVPKTKEELQKILFGDREEYHSPYNTDSFSTDDVAEIVWNDLKDQEPATEAKIKEELRNGCPMPDSVFQQFITPEPRYDGFKKGKDYDWDAYDKAWNRYCDQFLRFIDHKAIEEKRVFIFEYSDNEGNMRSAMEHGDLFEHCHNKLRVSHH